MGLWTPARILVAGLCVGLCANAAGADFTISLQVRAGGRQQSAASGQSGGARPALAAKVGETLLVQWSASNPESGATLSDVTLHVFIDRESGAVSPKAGPHSVYESAVVLDFAPGAKSTGELRLPVPEPGSYLLRVETIGADKKSGREYFAAVGVSVP